MQEHRQVDAIVLDDALTDDKFETQHGQNCGGSSALPPRTARYRWPPPVPTFFTLRRVSWETVVRRFDHNLPSCAAVPRYAKHSRRPARA